MRAEPKNSGDGANMLFSRLAAEKKKTVMAIGLIAVMVFMWAKVLGGGGPKSAKAALTGQKSMSAEKSDSQLKISFVELPEVKGRNDVLTRDFFTAGKSGDIKEVGIDYRDGNEEFVRRIAEKLRLEAIVMDENPQAFINDKLLRVGDKLLTGDGVDTYECEVVGIEENTVFIMCGEAKITLKISK